MAVPLTSAHSLSFQDSTRVNNFLASSFACDSVKTCLTRAPTPCIARCRFGHRYGYPILRHLIAQQMLFQMSSRTCLQVCSGVVSGDSLSLLSDDDSSEAPLPWPCCDAMDGTEGTLLPLLSKADDLWDWPPDSTGPGHKC